MFGVPIASELVVLIRLNLNLVALGKFAFVQGLPGQSGRVRSMLSRLSECWLLVDHDSWGGWRAGIFG